MEIICSILYFIALNCMYEEITKNQMITNAATAIIVGFSWKFSFMVIILASFMSILLGEE